ncbi:MAG: hypothetical protein HOO89_10150 [Ferruginibacter sp.]|nr:hypothetical protein [Ferruginibacter sp.]
MKQELNSTKTPSFIFCMAMDLVGFVSFSIPGIGEFSDIIWAPLSAFIFLKIFGGKLGQIGAVLNFVEEILPFVDVIPSFSIAWLIKSNILCKP